METIPKEIKGFIYLLWEFLLKGVGALLVKKEFAPLDLNKKSLSGKLLGMPFPKRTANNA